MPLTLFEKIWRQHVVARSADGRDLVYMDRHMLHERDSAEAFDRLRARGREIHRPDLTFAVQDHTVSTRPGRAFDDTSDGTVFIRALRENSRAYGIRLFDVGDAEQGISHVVAPEQGLVLPGSTYACPDSHACTVGGLGALGFGCGNSELLHVLATQTLALAKPKTLRVRFDGRLEPGVGAKDVVLFIIGQCGVDAGSGCSVEFSGSIIRALTVEGRLTLCNMAIEMGARSGLVAPDETVFSWLAGRPWAPEGDRWDRALGFWRTLKSDDDARYDREIEISCDALEPQITWGTDPSQVIGIAGRIPDPGTHPAMRRAIAYMDLVPGAAIEGLAVDRVFIGSCTNARLPDLEAAAEVIRGGHIAHGVTAHVVPGSTAVKCAAERKGLDRVFLAAGFSWGESGCSMCNGGNGDRGVAGERCVSTTNRNFEGRQGAGVRTHLASPAMAAAAALTGAITDVRKLMAGKPARS